MNREKFLAAYRDYRTKDIDNWKIGVDLLHKLSDRYGLELGEDFYTEGIQHIASIKPSMQHREWRFFRDTFVFPLEKVSEIIRDATTHGCYTMIERNTVSSLSDDSSTTMRYQIKKIEDMTIWSEYVDQVIGKRKGILSDSESRRLITFGSCFAVNVGRALRERGANVYSLLVAEDVNSTFNNWLMLRRIFLGEITTLSKQLSAIQSMDFDLVRDEFTNATDIIFTLGNIFHLEDEAGPTLHAKGGAKVITETIEETQLYLRKIFELLEEHTTGRIIVSVSPIPITGYRGLEFQSAVEADCVSKSQLRAVLNECLKDHPKAVYIPTFEIFRWLPAHQSFATFGVDDGSCRHLAKAHVAKVMEAIT